LLWDIYMVPHKKNPNIKVDIWHPAVGLRYIILPRDLSQLKTRRIPFDFNPRGKELCLTLAIFNVIFIAPPKKSKYKSWYLTPFYIARAVNWLKCLGGGKGILHLKPKEGCQISTFIFGLFGGSYRYPIKNCQRTAKFFPISGLIQRYFQGLKLT
jgi:hypothetical protein